jgi:hypothetical protein
VGALSAFGEEETLQMQRFSQMLRHPSIELLLITLVLSSALWTVHGARIQQHWSQLHWEDQLFFEHDRRTIHTWRDCWTQPALWPGLYRPLTTNCYYFVGGQLFQHRIEVYHAVNVTVHALNALLLYGLVRSLLTPLFALVAMALFASRHAHAEVLTNTAEFQVLAATAFALAALLLFVMGLPRRDWRLLPLIYLLLLLALVSKEAKLAVIPLLPLYVWLFVRPLRLAYLWVSVAGAVGAVGFLLATQQAVVDYQPTGFTYTAAPALILRNLTAHFWSFANYLAWDASDPVFPTPLRAVTESLVGQWILLAGVGGLLILLLYHARLPHVGRVLLFGALLFLLAALPYCFFTDRLFMRYGYFSHTGLAVATASALAWSVAPLRRFTPRVSNLS